MKFNRQFNKVNRLIALSVVYLFFAIYAAAESWNGIEPLVSTQSDVERIMGPCRTGKREDLCEYELTDRKVVIFYAQGKPCGDINKLWKVQENTVTSIWISLFVTTVNPIRSSGFDLKDFVIVDDEELPGWVHYSNEERGLSLSLDRGLLKEIKYAPDILKRNELSCK